VRGALNAEKPAPGPPWDLPIAEAPLAFVDLEMTGLDATKDRVVEICVERVVGAETRDRLHTLVRPEGFAAQGEIESIDPEVASTREVGNAHVHGIHADALAGAPTWVEIATRVEALLEGAVLVAHGAAWDVAFLEAESARAGRAMKIGYWLDTLNLSRRTFSFEKHSLDALRKHFGLDQSRAHRADADVAALRAVWDRCLAALEPSTPRDLWEVRIAERRARERILAECTDAAREGREITLVYRARGKPPEPLRMVLTELALGLDPPRVIGYQLPGRGRRELRADRILRIEKT
jgi:DNA polymerase-3 subunit epsilon